MLLEVWLVPAPGCLCLRADCGATYLRAAVSAVDPLRQMSAPGGLFWGLALSGAYVMHYRSCVTIASGEDRRIGIMARATGARSALLVAKLPTQSQTAKCYGSPENTASRA